MLTDLINENDRNGHLSIHLPPPVALFILCGFLPQLFFPFFLLLPLSFLLLFHSFRLLFSYCLLFPFLSHPLPRRIRPFVFSFSFPYCPHSSLLFSLPVSSLCFSSADAAFLSPRKKKRWEHCSCSLPPLPGVRCSVVWAVPALAGYSSSACSSGTNSLVSWVLWRAFRAASAASWQKMSWEVIFSFPLLSTFS